MLNNQESNGRVVGKAERQKRLLEIVKVHPVGTQTELTSLLASEGIQCTQVSVSRDLRELGLVKHAGRYVTPELPPGQADIEALGRSISPFVQAVQPVGENLLVVSTRPGTATTVSLILDATKWPGVAGTIAGDDTIFVAVHSGDVGRAVVDRLGQLVNKSL
ncbi:MAG: arginine repressor [Myxococcota bacterium]|jgi:transcriptional regulator of arginine metabolism|nr:arginine repressor [Myxococcota bacterium]